MHFACSRCKGIMEGMVLLIRTCVMRWRQLMDFVIWKTRLNSSDRCEVAVTVKVRVGWVRFRECGELLLENRFPLRIKGKIYCCCVRSAIVYESKTWCLNVSKKAILREWRELWQEPCVVRKLLTERRLKNRWTYWN